jgi:hypothetical protein
MIFGKGADSLLKGQHAFPATLQQPVSASLPNFTISAGSDHQKKKNIVSPIRTAFDGLQHLKHLKGREAR